MAIRKQAKVTRVPVSGNKDILTVKGKDNGFVYRWVNDKDGRIETFKAAGYETVDADVEVGTEDVKQASNIGSTVSKNVGQDTTAYLMKIDKKYYTEDQKTKAADVDSKEETLNEHLQNLSGRYGGIEIKR